MVATAAAAVKYPSGWEAHHRPRWFLAHCSVELQDGSEGAELNLTKPHCRSRPSGLSACCGAAFIPSQTAGGTA